MKKTFKFKLYKNKKNKYLIQQIELAGKLYNHCIALHKKYYKLYKKHLNVYKLQKHITKLKQSNKFKDLRDLNSQTIQDVAQRIDKAYQLFFYNIKHKIKSSPPGFKKVKKYKSFTLKQCGYKFLEDNKIKIKNKIFKYSKSRAIEGKIKTVTIKRDNLDNLYLYVICDVRLDNQNRTMTGKIASFDFGLKTFLTSHTGEKIESPMFYTKLSTAIAKANRKLSRKNKLSNNHKKARTELSSIYQKLINKRNDHHFKLANKLAKEYDYLFFEDLNIKQMQKVYGKKISDLSFSSFLKILDYECQKYGSKLIKIDRYYPSSKTCSVCGSINNNLKIKDKSWICQSCGTEHDRDINAAKNIYMVGASTIAGDTVRPDILRQVLLIAESHRL